MPLLNVLCRIRDITSVKMSSKKGLSVATQNPGLVVSHYCVGCGKGLIASAAICPFCGTPVKGNSTSRGKDKAVAVVLAVFLSGWTWLYTYRFNAAKFWIYIGGSFFLILTGIASFAASLDAYDPEPAVGVIAFVYVVSFAFWLWAVIDSATKPREYYENYG